MSRILLEHRYQYTKTLQPLRSKWPSPPAPSPWHRSSTCSVGHYHYDHVSRGQSIP